MDKLNNIQHEYFVGSIKTQRNKDEYFDIISELENPEWSD